MHDRDGKSSRRQALDNVEHKVQVPGACMFLAEAAWEEIETWVLAGPNFPTKWEWRWQEIRKGAHVNEGVL